MRTKTRPKKQVAAEVRTLSNSEAVTFLACRKKWYWRHERNLVPLAEPTPLVVGKAWHAFLEALYNRERIDEERIAEEHIGRAAKSGFLDENQLEDLEKQKAMVVGMMMAYRKMYPDDPEKYEVIGAEKKGSFRISDGYKMFFTVDLLVRRRSDKTVWVMEHKSTQTLEADYVLRLDLDTQIPTYLVGVERDFGLKPVGVIYNAVRKPAIRQKQSEDRGAYLRRVVEVYENAPTEYLFRAEYVKGSGDLDAYLADLNSLTADIDAARKTGFFPKNSRECFNKGTCPYLRLCTQGEDALDGYRVQRDNRYDDVEGK